MTFSPIVPFGGFAGWTFLKRTLDRQTVAFQASPQLQRDEAYFREKIGGIKTAEDLVSDRRLLRVALGAFGLDADINNRFFIRKVLEDGTLADTALSSRLSDKRYRDMSAAFGFGDFPVSRNQIGGFADKILAQYESRQFEIAVGQTSNSMRLALNAEREVPLLAAKTLSEDAKWFTIMGNAPLRQVFQTALNLPQSFASVDIDQQLGVLKERAERFFGSSSVSQFADPAKLDALMRRYVTVADLGGPQGGTSSQSAALQLLQSARGAGGLLR